MFTSILCVLASPQYNLFASISRAMPFGQPRRSDTNSTRSLPSREARSILGSFSNQSDQNIQPRDGATAMARGSCKSSFIRTWNAKVDILY